MSSSSRDFSSSILAAGRGRALLLLVLFTCFYYSPPRHFLHDSSSPPWISSLSSFSSPLLFGSAVSTTSTPSSVSSSVSISEDEKNGGSDSASAIYSLMQSFVRSINDTLNSWTGNVDEVEKKEDSSVSTTSTSSAAIVEDEDNADSEGDSRISSLWESFLSSVRESLHYGSGNVDEVEKEEDKEKTESSVVDDDGAMDAAYPTRYVNIGDTFSSFMMSANVDEKDHGMYEITLKPYEPLVVKMRGIPGTGYVWTLGDVEEKSVNCPKEEVEKCSVSQPKIVEWRRDGNSADDASLSLSEGEEPKELEEDEEKGTTEERVVPKEEVLVGQPIIYESRVVIRCPGEFIITYQYGHPWNPSDHPSTKSVRFLVKGEKRSIR